MESPRSRFLVERGLRGELTKFWSNWEIFVTNNIFSISKFLDNLFFHIRAFTEGGHKHWEKGRDVSTSLTLLIF